MKRNKELERAAKRRAWVALVVLNLLALALAFACVGPAKAQEGEDVSETIEEEKGFAGEVSFFSEGRFWKQGDTDSDLGWTRLRVTAGDVWGFQTELELAGLDDSHFEDSNIVQRALVWRKLDEWTVSLGRVFLAAGYSTPAPGYFKTARYPDPFPWGFYAYGLQSEGPVGAWRLRSDLTGTSGLAYNDGDQFSRLEFSSRLSREFGPVEMGLSAQASEEFVRSGADVSWSGGPVSLVGAVLHTDESVDTSFTGFILGEWQVHQWLTPHLQFVREAGEGADVWSAGMGVSDPVKPLYGVIDVDQNGKVSMRVQLRMRTVTF